MTGLERKLRGATVLSAGLVLAAVLSGCTGSKTTADPAPTATTSSAPSSADTGGGGLAGGGGEDSTAPRSTIMTTPKPSLSTPNGVKEVDGTCPYISNQDFADGEGDRVGRVTLLQTKPVGCRFYFQYDVNTVIGEIDVATFKTKVQAYNAMVGSAKGHPEVQSDPNIGDGAVAFQRPLQGTNAWLCVFAKNKTVVTVRTQQPYPALNALNLARNIAPRFK
jgi:hypothetical protein